jgi:hypothetical protein
MTLFIVVANYYSKDANALGIRAHDDPSDIYYT